MPNINKKLIDTVFERYNRVKGPFRYLLRSKPIRALDQLANKENTFLDDKLIARAPLIEILLNIEGDDSATRYAFRKLKKQFTDDQRACFIRIHSAGLLSHTDIEPIWQSRTIATFLRDVLRDFSRANLLNEYTLSHITELVKTPAGWMILKATHYLFQTKLLKNINIKKLFEHATAWQNNYEYLSVMYKLDIPRERYVTAIKRGLENLRNAGILDQNLYETFLKYPPFCDFADAIDILSSHNILDHDIALELYEHHLSYAFYDEHNNSNDTWKMSPKPESRTPQNVALGLVSIAISKLTLGLTKENRILWYSVIGSGFTDEIIEAMDIFNSLNILTQPLLEKLVKMHYPYIPSYSNISDTHCDTEQCQKILQHAENFKYTVKCLSELYENNKLDNDSAYELLDNCESPNKIDEIIQRYQSQPKDTKTDDTCSIPLPLSDEARFHPYNKHKKDGLIEFCKDAPRTNSEKLSLRIKGHPILLEGVKKLEEKFKEKQDDLNPESIEKDPDFKFLNDELTSNGTKQLLDGFHQSLMSAPNMILSQYIKSDLGTPLQSDSITTNIELNNHDHALEIKTIAKKFHVYTEENGDITLKDAQIGNPQVLVEFHPDEKSQGFLLNAKTDDIELSKAILMSHCNMRLEKYKKLKRDKTKCVYAFFRNGIYAVEDFYIAAYQNIMCHFPENESLILVLKKLNHLPQDLFTNIDFLIGFMYIRQEVNTLLQYIETLLKNKNMTISQEFQQIMQYYHHLKRALDDDLKSELTSRPEINVKDLMQYQKNINKDISYLEEIQKMRTIIHDIVEFGY